MIIISWDRGDVVVDDQWDDKYSWERRDNPNRLVILDAKKRIVCIYPEGSWKRIVGHIFTTDDILSNLS